MTAPHQNLLGTSGAVADTEETDPNFNQTILLLHSDGTNGGTNNTFLDSSTGSHTFTRYGNTTQGTFNPFLGEGQYSRYSKTGSSRDSHGSGVTLGTNNFTIGMFVYPIGRSDTNGLTLNSGSNNRTTLYADTGGETVILAHNQFLTAFTGSAWGVEINFTTAIALNQWQWIQIDRTGNTFRVSIDGSYVDGGGVTNSSSIPEITAGTFGQRSGQDVFLGYYNNFIIINGANRGSITPPTTSLTADSYTAILLHQSNRFVNNGNTSVTLTSGGDNKIVPFSPLAPTASYSESVHGGSGFFDGTDDYIAVDDHSDFHFGTNDLTIEFWIYPRLKIGEDRYICGQSSSGSASDTAFQIYLNDVSVTGWFRIGGNNRTVTGTVDINSWSHVAVVRQSGVIRIYIDGVQEATETDSGSVNNSGGVLAIGRVGAHNNNYFNGYIANYNLINGTCKYPDGTTFSIPTAPVSAHSNTKLLALFTNASVIDHSMKNNIETVGDAQLDTTVKKFGTASVEFPSGDALQYDSGKGLALGTGPFTVEFFVRFIDNVNADGSDGNNSRASIVRSVGTGGGNMVIQRYNQFTGLSSDPQWRVGTETNPEIKVSQNLSNGVFYHVAMTRDSSNKLRLFVDGTMLGSSTSFTQDFPENDFYFANFGRTGGSSRFLNGFLDEIRITKGVARYDSDSGFTAPTKAFANR